MSELPIEVLVLIVCLIMLTVGSFLVGYLSGTTATLGDVAELDCQKEVHSNFHRAKKLRESELLQLVRAMKSKRHSKGDKK